MRWPEALVLAIVAAGATVIAALRPEFDPLTVYAAVVAWGARGAGTAAASQLELRSPVVRKPAADEPQPPTPPAELSQ